MSGDKITGASLRHIFPNFGQYFEEEMALLSSEADLDRVKAHNATLDPAIFAGTHTSTENESSQETPHDDPLPLPPGLAGEAVKWLEAGNHVPNMVASMASVLGFSSAVCGRAYYNDSPQGADGINLYLCLLAASGGGKEWMWGGVRRMMYEAGLSSQSGRILGAKPASGTALAERIEEVPSTIVPLPEVGKWLQRILSKNASGAEKSLEQEILSLYSMSGPHSVYSGIAKAGKQGVRAIYHPSVVLLGESTHSSLWDALSDEASRSGLISRIIVLDSGEVPGVDRYSAVIQKPPVTILEVLQAMGSRWTTESPERIPVRWSQAAKDADRDCFAAWSSEKRESSNDVREVISRQRQNGPRIAANLALWSDPVDPVVSPEMVQWAWMVVDAGCRRVLEAFKSGDIQGAGASPEDILLALARDKAKETQGHTVTRKTLQNFAKRRPMFRESLATGAYSRLLSESIKGLIESGLLVQIPDKDRPDGALGKVYIVSM